MICASSPLRGGLLPVLLGKVVLKAAEQEAAESPPALTDVVHVAALEQPEEEPLREVLCRLG
jgi:hypothetical protein